MACNCDIDCKLDYIKVKFSQVVAVLLMVVNNLVHFLGDFGECPFSNTLIIYALFVLNFNFYPCFYIIK